ncbi:MAG TPA: hypothetical protein VG649_18660 [Candidatus Angelobacter sp.]|nr:hypothetical protein [Candidatus Angelobacter sp.]
MDPMVQMSMQSNSDLIRNYVRESLLKPAIKKGERVIKVNAGAVHRALGLNNRIPMVCAALRSKKLLQENRLRIVSKTGPPSGQSTTVTFTYEILARNAKPSVLAHPLIGLRGIAKEVFRKLGGGESFIRGERSKFVSHQEK